MSLSIKKKIELIFVFLILSAYSTQVNSSTTKLGATKKIVEISTNKAFKNALLSFYAVNLNTKEIVGAVNPNTSLIPASSLKLLTTAAGLEVLGSEFKFQTKIQYEGEIDTEGTLKGNIYIKGGGDPALGSNMFKKHYYEPHFLKEWVDAIANRGIKRITGAIIGDPQLYGNYEIPTTWTVEDLGNDYGAGYSGLSIFDNIYTVFFVNGPERKERPTIFHITPHLPEEIQIINEITQGDTCNTCVYGLPYHNTRVIKGTITSKELNFVVKGSIPDPAYWAAYMLDRELKKQGIKVEEEPTTIRRRQNRTPQKEEIVADLVPSKQVSDKDKLLTDIYVTYSPPLKSIVGIINRDSNNLYAEHIVNQIGLKAAGKWDTENGIKALANFWYTAGIDTLGMFLQDGSGLSRYNALTTKQLVDVLCYMKSSLNFDSFYHSLPIAGETGTLKDLFTKAPLKGNLKAKTGGLRRVLSYTGYCTNIRGEEIAFSLIINNYNGTPNEVRKEVEKLLTALVDES